MSKQKNKSDFKAKSMVLLLKSTIQLNNRENTGNFRGFLRWKDAAKSPGRSSTLQRLFRQLQCYMTANLYSSLGKYVTEKKKLFCVCHLRLAGPVSATGYRSAEGEWWDIYISRERLEIDLLQVDLLASGASLFQERPARV